MEEGISIKRKLIDNQELDSDYNSIQESMFSFRRDLARAEMFNDTASYKSAKRGIRNLKSKVDSMYKYIRDELNIEMTNKRIIK